MPGIGIGISPHFQQKKSLSSYWATLLTTIGYSHPMLPGLTIDKVAGVWTITSHTIDDFIVLNASTAIKYVDATNGDDTKDGNSWANAYKTLTKLDGVVFKTAYLAVGNYASSNVGVFWRSTRQLIGSTGGDVNICNGYIGSELTWTDEGGGMFSASLTASRPMVVDTSQTNADGYPLGYSKVADSTAVAAAVNTFYHNSGTNTIYVHCSDGNTPLRTTIMVATKSMAAEVGNDVSIENINIFGGFGFSVNNATARHIAAKNCKFLYGKYSSGYAIVGNVQSWVEDCISAYNQADGFSYKLIGTYNAHAVEVNCKGHNCGGVANSGLLDSSNNGSTSHDSSIVLRVNGEYYNTEGRQVHDVGAAITLNINCNAHDSTSAAAAAKGAFCVGTNNAGTAKVYLFDCTTSGVDTNGVENFGGANSHIYGRLITGIHSVKAGTTLETF